VKRYRLHRSTLLWAGAAALVLLAVAAGMTAHFFSVERDAAENRTLRSENLALKGRLTAMHQRLDQLGSTVDRVERFDQKLRGSTLHSDPQRLLAIGPTEPGLLAPWGGDLQPNPASAPDGAATLSSRLDELLAEAAHDEQSLQELQSYFQDQSSKLAATPSTWPVRGWVSSDFGQRADPFGGDRLGPFVEAHHGLDISAAHGAQVFAPSDGTVVFAGLEGGYGNVVVIDHGYGIKTRYGHLSSMQVKPGDRVKRAQRIAAVGTTGRSTGPHLHYEVRVNGLQQNPRKYILEE
jgi:murein DD-endopeptidase MepM/ murein hydrolase activator NlpD